jgi:hypothetical protein
MDRAGTDHGGTLIGPRTGALDQLPLKFQQLRCRVLVHAQAAVVGDPDGALLEEPVGRLLDLDERLLSVGDDREPLGQGRPPRRSG